MDDWYNDSLPRYPRILIQKEQESSPSALSYQTDTHRVGGNVIRIRVHGRRKEGEELEPPKVTVHRYDNSAAAPADTRRSAGVIPVPIQVRCTSATPVTNIAYAQQHSGPKTKPGFVEPMKAHPLSSLLQDFNANQFEKGWSRSRDNHSNRDFPLSQRVKGSFSHSFEQEFDKFTSEYSSRTKSPLTDRLSGSKNSSAYTFRRHGSEEVARIRHRSTNSPDRGAVRAPSPNLFVSTYSQATGKHSSRIVSPSPLTATEDNTSYHSRASERDSSSVVRARDVLDRVLKNLVSKDYLKGRRNSIVNEARNSIRIVSEELESADSEKTCVDDNDSGYSGSGGTGGSGFTWSSLEIKENVRKYNSSHHDSQFTEVPGSDETFQGDIQICICLEKPVNMLLSTKPSSLFRSPSKQSSEEERITASATIPNNTVTKLHITSNDTTEMVVEMLLKKFSFVECPKSFGLFEQTLNNEKEVKLRKTASSEKPLLNFLRWKTESQEQKKFILKESYDSDIVWESFSVPELSNFLIMLEMEHKEQEKDVCNKYLSYKHNLETRMKELRPNNIRS